MSRRTHPDLTTSRSALSRRAALVGAAQAVVMLAGACTRLPQLAAPSELPAPTPSVLPPTLTPTLATSIPGAAQPASTCLSALPAIRPPTPIPYPGYVQVEPSTGLHVTAEPEIIDLATYKLAVNGNVARELSLSYDELRCLPRTAARVTIECPGFFIDRSNLAGASLASVLALAGPLDGAQQVIFVGVDGRTERVPLVDGLGTDYFLAYEWEGEALPVSHGFPIRAALPGRLGGNWVKWVREISIA